MTTIVTLTSNGAEVTTPYQFVELEIHDAERGITVGYETKPTPIGQMIGILVSISVNDIINKFDDRTDEFENFYDPALLQRYIDTLGREGALALLLKMMDVMGNYLAGTGVMEDVIAQALIEAGLDEKFKAIKGDYTNPAYDNED